MQARQQNPQQPVPANLPQYVYPEDEISLVDIWLVIVRHRKVFWMTFGLVVLAGLLLALLLPRKYNITTAIDIGQTVVDGKAVPLESPETVKAKLENSLIPNLLDKSPDVDIRKMKVEVSIPKQSELVVLKSKVLEGQSKQVQDIHKRVVAALLKDHQRLIAPTRSNLKATIDRLELGLDRLKDQRFFDPQVKSMESKLLDANAKLRKLEDPTIQGLRIKSLELALAKEKERLASMKDQEAVLHDRKERLEKMDDLLSTQIEELKKQIKQALSLQEAAVADVKDGSQAMAMLLIENEIQQNRNRLNKLEERLYVDLENQRSDLDKKIGDNKRDQLHELGVIDTKEKALDKYRIDIKMEQEKQQAIIAKLKADQIKIPAEREQEIKLKNQKLSEMQERLATIIETKSVGEPARSQLPVSLSKRLLLVLAVFLGIMLGLFGTFLAEFRSKVRTIQNEI